MVFSRILSRLRLFSVRGEMMGYLQSYENGILQKRRDEAMRLLAKCMLCPRRCSVDRMKGEAGFCRTGRYARVASYGPHFGEESCLVGTGGSGTIFFCGCNLLCSFCQNYGISRGIDEDCIECRPAELAHIMVALQENGCHNINLVTPTHVTAQILEAMPIAIENGLTVPMVYNCGGYEDLGTLRLLDGIVDIYMPDAKFYYPEPAARFLSAPDYPERMCAALIEMQRQVGDLQISDSGLAVRGLLVRHLLMPAGLADAKAICRFLAEKVSKNCYLNLMDQYRPCGEVIDEPDMRTSVGPDMYQDAIGFAKSTGLHRLDQKDFSNFLARLFRT